MQTDRFGSSSYRSRVNEKAKARSIFGVASTVAGSSSIATSSQTDFISTVPANETRKISEKEDLNQSPGMVPPKVQTVVPDPQAKSQLPYKQSSSMSPSKPEVTTNLNNDGRLKAASNLNSGSGSWKRKARDITVQTEVIASHVYKRATPSLTHEKADSQGSKKKSCVKNSADLPTASTVLAASLADCGTIPPRHEP